MSLSDFKKELSPKKAIIGFDYGSKRLGVAVSDLTLTIATSYTIVQRQSKATDFAQIKKIIAEKEIGGMVFGLPLQMNGQEGEIAAETRAFAQALQKETGLPCAFWDERLSSSAVESFLIQEVDLSRNKRKKNIRCLCCSLHFARFSRRIKKSLIFIRLFCCFCCLLFFTNIHAGCSCRYNIIALRIEKSCSFFDYFINIIIGNRIVFPNNHAVCVAGF